MNINWCQIECALIVVGCLAACQRPDPAPTQKCALLKVVHPLEDVVLHSPSPLPALDTVTLSFYLPEHARVEVNVLDHTGQLYEQPWQGWLPAGAHELELPLDGLASGPWVYALSGYLGTTRRSFVRTQVVVVSSR